MTRLSADQEVIAMKTAGLSFAQLLPPVLGFSLAVGLLTLGLTVFASPLRAAGDQRLDEGGGQAAGRYGHPRTDV